MRLLYCPACGQKLAKKDVQEISDGSMTWYIIKCSSCQVRLRIKMKEVQNMSGVFRVVNMETGQVCESADKNVLKKEVRRWVAEEDIHPDAVIIENADTYERTQWDFIIDGKKVVVGRK